MGGCMKAWPLPTLGGPGGECSGRAVLDLIVNPVSATQHSVTWGRTWHLWASVPPIYTMESRVHSRQGGGEDETWRLARGSVRHVAASRHWCLCRFGGTPAGLHRELHVESLGALEAVTGQKGWGGGEALFLSWNFFPLVIFSQTLAILCAWRPFVSRLPARIQGSHWDGKSPFPSIQGCVGSKTPQAVPGVGSRLRRPQGVRGRTRNAAASGGGVALIPLQVTP